MRKGKIVIRPAKGKQVTVRYFGPNGRLLAPAEDFKTKRSAIGNIRAMGRLFGLMAQLKFGTTPLKGR